MDQNRYALEFERTIFNWYYGGEDAAPEPIFNAIHAGLNNDMQMLVPIETSEAFFKSIGDPSQIKVGDTFSTDEEIRIKFRHLVVNEQEQYFIPLCTNDNEMNKGESTSLINQSLKSLFDEVDIWPDCLGFIINPWDKKLLLTKEMIQVVLNYKPKSHISFVKGSVTDMHVGSIVNAANTSLLGGGGVDGAIHRGAGPDLLKECRTLHGCNIGEAKISGTYNIHHADFIIHTVGPVYSGKERDAALLAACYSNSLDLALKNGCTSIAFPCISTGAYSFPLNVAAKVSLFAAIRWLDAHPDVIMNIYFCCYKDAELKTYTSFTN